MDSRYRARYAQLHSRHWWWRAREALVVEALTRHACRPRSQSRRLILEVGCASGLNFPALRPFGSVSGVEPDPRWWEGGATHPAEPIWQGDLQTFPAAASSFDIAIALDVFEHIPDDHAVVRQLRELLVADGLLVVNVPAWPRLWTRHDDLNHHLRRYSPGNLRALLQQSGFGILELRSLFGWLLLPKLAVALKERYLQRPAATAEAALPGIPARPLNAALTACSIAESRLLGCLPAGFGSSLLAVARRRRRG